MPLGNAILIAALPSSIALLRGLLPAPIAMLIPYIIISNIILISSFSAFKKTPWIGVLTASLAKFSFLYVIVYIVAGQLNANLIAMFQWPQLITALLGGFIFLNLTRFVKSKN